MTAQLLDGIALSTKLRAQLSARVEALVEQGRRPGLAVVLVGEDPASQIYVRNKVKACADVGIHSEMLRMPASTSEAQLLARIDRLNADNAIHGILIQTEADGATTSRHQSTTFGSCSSSAKQIFIAVLLK